MVAFLAGRRNVRVVFWNVGQIDVASGLPLQASFRLKSGLSCLQNFINLIKRLIVPVVDFSRHLETEDKSVSTSLTVKGSEKTLMICKYRLPKEINNHTAK